VESTSLVPSLVDVPARLSSAQKRDLLGQAVAAVITTALIAAPLLTSPSGSVDVSSETTLPAQSFAAAVTAVPAEATISRVLPRRPRVSRARIRTEGTLMASAVPATTMQPAAVGTSGYAGVVDAVPERAGTRKPLSRKLMTWLTGDGTVSVRPFPTIAERQ